MLVKARRTRLNLLQSLGQFLGALDAALANFAHSRGASRVEMGFGAGGMDSRASRSDSRWIATRAREKFLGLYESEVLPF